MSFVKEGMETSLEPVEVIPRLMEMQMIQVKPHKKINDGEIWKEITNNGNLYFYLYHDDITCCADPRSALIRFAASHLLSIEIFAFARGFGCYYKLYTLLSRYR